MPRCAFLTMHNMDEFECYDHLLVEPLKERNWEVTEVPWRNTSVDWNKFEAVIIRSPWDYQDAPGKFLDVLKTIDRSSARLENALDIVQWNLDKRYLQEMELKSIPIVPTHWQDKFEPNCIPPLFKKFGTDELIIKPVISANADNTHRLSKKNIPKKAPTLAQVFNSRAFMVQPFMEHIVIEGEYSLFYFGGAYSHAILKTPARGDFRVQEEHGGRLKTVEPEKQLSHIGEQTMQALPKTPLYARVDFVRTTQNNFALMELELIEPSLYFNMDTESPRRFAEHFDRWMKN